MKKYLYIMLVLALLGCDSENAPDCIQTAGDLVQIPYELPVFTKIRMEQNTSLVIKQGAMQEVTLETGNNLLSDIKLYVEDGVLVMRDNNDCNYVRDFGLTKIYVTTPNITEIRNGSSYGVVGEGVLNFPELTLISNTTGGFDEFRKSGDFTLSIHTQNFRVESNGFSGFFIDGKAENARISFEDEVTRFEGQHLEVDHLRIFHRSANKMIVNPLFSIRGQIVGAGDVIAVNRPEIVEVEELYTGRLLFQ